MGKRVLVVGGVAGGASAAARVRRLDAEASITVFERGEHVSFSNCSLPYFLSRTVGDAESLVLMTPEGFKASYDIDVRTSNEACAIDRAAKKVRVRNELTGEELTIMKMEVNGLTFDVCVPSAQITGEPAPGRRFKGNIWLQGRINF